MKLLKREDGQAMVEFALVIPILLLLVCGIIDFGWMFYNQLALRNGCREGARYACVNSTAATIETDVTNKVAENIPNTLTDLDVDVIYSDLADPTAGDVTVEVEVKFTFMTPFLSAIYQSDSRMLHDEVVMKVES